MSTLDTTAWPTPARVAGALDEVLRSTGEPVTRPPLTYLRRKPGRGLVAVYGSARDPRSIYTVTVDEATRGVAVQRFPHDERLPDLAAAMTPARGGPLWRALERAAGQAALVAVEAAAVRYKPGDRCVIRYGLQAESSTGIRQQCTVVGKLYQGLGEAMAAHALAERLWLLQPADPWTARPLGVAEPLPLVLSEDLGSRDSDPPALPGTDVIRFGASQPTDALRRAAHALADLHCSGEALPDAPARSGRDESAKAAKRAKALTAYVPELAATVAVATQALTQALDSLPGDTLRPAHGSYKPSQLLFRNGAVFLVDFDQFCRADAALDVGYFLAYLRPPGLWYHRAGTRSWFETAAATFLDAYDERLADRGVDEATRAGIRARSHVYEAALLLKIAARRPNRLHSPRPGEVQVVLDDVMRCLAAADRR